MSDKEKEKINSSDSTPKLKKPKKPKKGKRLFNGVLVKLVALAAVIGCAVLFISTESDRSEKKRELALIEEKIAAYNIENGELKRILESEDLSAYIERVALEERGYAYPDERRFYDTSRD